MREAVGRSSMVLASTLLVISPRVVSSSGTSLVTVTSVLTAVGESLKSRVLEVFSSTCAVRLCVPRPGAAAVILYAPNGRNVSCA